MPRDVGRTSLEWRLRDDGPSPSAILWRVFREALASPWRLAGAVAASAAGAVANLALPKLIGRAVDQANGLLSAGSATPKVAVAGLLTTAGLVIAATAGRGLLAMIAGHVGETLSQQVALQLRLRYFAHLQQLSAAFHDRVHSGDLITRGMIDLEGMRGFIQTVLVQAVPLVLLISLAGMAMFEADAGLAALSLGFAPIAGVILARNGVLLRKTWFGVQEMMSRLTLVMEENLHGARVVRAFAAKTFELAKFDRAAGEILALQFRRITLRFAGLTWMTAAFYVSMTLLLWFGGAKVMAGAMSAGELAAFVAYLTLLQGPIRHVAMITNASARAVSSGARMFEILDQAPTVRDAPGASPLKAASGVVRFDHVSFRYRPGQPDVLHDISFELHPGKTLGIVGPPGSGKSTIAALLARFYDVTSGAITLDGVDIRVIALASLRAHVGVVAQETFLFDAPIGHNIAYADPWADEAQIIEAACTAQLHDQIALMPDGYGARIGERGVSLSGGQRQRTAIARGVLPGPGVIVFDDSTAAIDAATEQRVRQALAEATRAKSTIIIAHRLGSLMHADEIIVLDGGRIVERGSHQGLLALQGAYAALHALQSHQAQAGVAEASTELAV